MACFVWGAIFGNAILSQPIHPLNLILEPPERMLSPASQQWLEDFRTTLRSISNAFTGEVIDSLRKHLRGWEDVTTPPTPSPPPHAASQPPSTEAFAACSDQFPEQRPLQVSIISMQWAPLALCSDSFAVLYSGLTKTPLVVIEKLNRQRLLQAAGLERSDQFFPDTRVPTEWRAALTDYQGSGFDRGHLAAAANQPTPQAMAQSFALSNMVPQDPTHNRKVWSKLEADTRKYALRAAGNVYVFSGALHQGTIRTIGRNAVWIPSHLFKLVYDEAGQRAWAHVIPNRSDAQITRPMDYHRFMQLTQWPLLTGLKVTGSLR